MKKNIMKIKIERIQREHDDALRKISQLSYENDAL